MYLQGPGLPELPLIFLKFGHRGDYGKVRYTPYMTVHT